MNLYFVETKEEIYTDDGLSQYAKSEKVTGDMNLAKSKYFKKCSDLSADIGKGHTYARVRLTDMYDNDLDHTLLGVLGGEQAPTEA